MSVSKIVSTVLVALALIASAAVTVQACAQVGADEDGGTEVSDFAVPAPVSYDAGQGSGGPGGPPLPLGYYERQCQWDACGGPKDRLPVSPEFWFWGVLPW